MSRSKDYLTIEATNSDQLFTDSNGGLRSTRFDDIYYHPGQGAEESQHVFLAGNDLPNRWLANDQQTPSKDYFVIAETGFGSGLNFLACWQLWRDSHRQAAADQAPRTLYFYSSELYPLSSAALKKSIRHYNPFPDLATELHNHYPDAIGGDYLIELDTDTPFPVVLVLLFGDSNEAFKRLEYYPIDHFNRENDTIIEPTFNAAERCDHRGLTVDAWFLDGYAPTKNPDLWKNSIYALMAQHSSSNSTVATFTVARTVRDGLTKHGFAVKKVSGFGRKREMLTGTFQANIATTLTATKLTPMSQSRKALSDLSNCYYPATQPRHNVGEKKRRATIVGAGIAGCCTAYQLAKRGWQVNLVDSHGEVASAASGNRAALQSPHLTVDHNAMSRLSAACLSWAARCSDAAGATLAAGVLALDAPDRIAARHAILRQQRWPASLLRDADTALDAETGQGIFYEYGRAIRPSILVKALSEGAEFRGEFNVASITMEASHLLLDAVDGRQLQADAVVLAGGSRVADLLHLVGHDMPVEVTRGQVSHVPATSSSASLATGVSFGGYLTPSWDGLHEIGATFSRDLEKPEDATAAHAHNFALLPAGIAGLFHGMTYDGLGLRTSYRASLADRRPVTGRIADNSWIFGGLGARGFTLAPLLGEMLAAQILDRPVPLARDQQASLAAARYLSQDAS